MILCKLNGQWLNTNDFAGIEDAKLTVRQEQDGESAFSYGSNVRLYGVGITIIRNTIFQALNPYLAFCQIEFFDDCCLDSNNQPTRFFVGKIGRGDIQWCENPDEPCYYEVSFVDDSQEAQGLRCIKNTAIVQTVSNDGAITSAGIDEDRLAPFLLYYAEPRPTAWAFAIIILGIWLAVIALPISILIGLFSLGAVPFNYLSNLFFSFVLSEKKHVTPYLLSYVKNVCKLCGLNLQSSLFDATIDVYTSKGVFYDVVRLDAPYKEGRKFNVDALDVYNNVNFPNITLSELLDSLRLMNVRYQVEGTNLVVERKDYFSNVIWLDLTTRQESDILSICFQPNDEQPKAGRWYRWANDQSDKVGAELVQDANYLANYNQPFNPLLSGIDQVVFPYSLCRRMDDGADLSAIQFIIDETPFFTFLTGVSQDRAIIQTGTFGTPKLVQVKEVGFREVVPYDRNTLGIGQVHLDLRPQQSIHSDRTMYDKLLAIDDLRTFAPKSQDVEIKIKWYCNDFRTFQLGHMVRFRSVEFGVVNGIVSSCEFGFDGILTIQAKI